jgi:putative transposase
MPPGYQPSFERNPLVSTRIRKQSIRQPTSFVELSRDPAELRALLEQQLQGAAQQFVYGLMLQEVQELCGTFYQRTRQSQEGVYRAGSDPGSVKLQGQRLKVKKPRLKQAGREVPLRSYQALQGFDLLQPDVLAHLLKGVSTRDYDPLLKQVSGGLGLKKSSVSKAFVRGSRQALDQLRGRDLSKKRLCAVFIDAIVFSGRRVVVALGLDSFGQRLVLGLREGTTENAEVCQDLLQTLLGRGLDVSRPLLFVIDGGKGARRAIRNVLGERHPVQRCTVHKARNIEAYLPEKAHLEFRSRWFKLHRLERYSEAKRDYDSLRRWLSRMSHEGLNSLDEAQEETLTVVRLGTGRTLRRSLHSTNMIEGLFDKVRMRTRRVKNWKRGSDQILRWTAACLLDIEPKWCRIHGYFEIDAFLTRMQGEEKPLPQATQAA